MHRRVWTAPLLVIGGYVALSAAWIGANPPGAGPDEPAHYIRAAGISQGQLIGQPVAVARRPTDNDASYRFGKDTTRAVWLPARLTPAPGNCYAMRPRVTAACLQAVPVASGSGMEATNVAVYQPVPYFLPALLVALAPDHGTALYLARLGVALLTGLLVALSVLLVLRTGGGALPLLGVLLAASPMVVYLGAIVSSSGVEIASSLCFFAALVRLRSESSGRAPNWVMATLGASGLVLALSRPFGPLWVLLGIGFFALLGPPPSLARDRRIWAVAASLALGIGLSLAWTRLSGQQPVVSLQQALQGLSLAPSTVSESVLEQVGVMGWLDTRMIDLFYQAWLGAVALLVVVAVAVGGWRQSLLLLALVAGGYLVMIGVAAMFLPLGLPDPQGRYTMPFTVWIPIYAADVIYQGRTRLGSFMRGALPVLVGLVAAAGQALAWWLNARRYAVGTGGHWLFLTRPVDWSPPLGWTPWLALAILGSACLLASLVASSLLLPPRDEGVVGTLEAGRAGRGSSVVTATETC